MSLAASSPIASACERRLAPTLGKRLALCLPTAVVVALAVILRAILPANADMSWIITICERVLAGAHLYSDILETNPPATVWLYMPPVLLARLSGLRPELVIDAGIFLGACASILLCVRMADRAGTMPLPLKAWLIAVAALVLLVLPARTFTEREQIAVFAIAPYLVLAIIRMEGRALTLLHALAAGIGIGFVVSIKPHFGAAVGLVAIVVAWRRRDWRLLFVPEHLVAAGMFFAYVATIFYYYPDYWRGMIPLLRTVYLPVRLPGMMIIATPSYLFIAAMLLLFVSTRDAADGSRYSVAFAAAAGFAAAFLVQGQGWSYHTYPMLAVVTFAALAAIISGTLDIAAPANAQTLAARFGAWTAACMLCFGIFITMARGTDHGVLLEAVRRIKERPSIAVVSDDLALAHPLVRALGGTFVGRTCSQWITHGAMFVRQYLETSEAERETLARLEAFDADLVATDLAKRPDIVLVERTPIDYAQWIAAHKNVAAELANYRFVERLDGIEIFAHRAN
jgi:hypothetical protein